MARNSPTHATTLRQPTSVIGSRREKLRITEPQDQIEYGYRRGMVRPACQATFFRSPSPERQSSIRSCSSGMAGLSRKPWISVTTPGSSISFIWA